MQEDDQRERTGEAPASWHDEERTERLVEILDEYGWPGHDLVGEDGSTAAWVIAQHSDLDPEVQAQALELLRARRSRRARPAPATSPTSRTAWRWAPGARRCTAPRSAASTARRRWATSVDPERVDERRAEAGLGPLADYLEELRPACEEEAAAGAEGTAATDPG